MPRTDKPASQPLPSFAPSLERPGQGIGLFNTLARGCITCLALRRLQEQRLNERVKGENVLGDAAGAAHEIADKSIKVVDQSLLIRDDSAGISLLEFDAPTNAGHERLGIVRQSFEDADQVAKYFVHLGGIRNWFLGEHPQNLQLAGNVFKGDRLQFGPSLKRPHENA